MCRGAFNGRILVSTKIFIQKPLSGLCVSHAFVCALPCASLIPPRPPVFVPTMPGIPVFPPEQCLSSHPPAHVLFHGRWTKIEGREILLSRLWNSERNVGKCETRAESLKTSDKKHGQLKKVVQDFQKPHSTKVYASITLRVQPPQAPHAPTHPPVLKFFGQIKTTNIQQCPFCSSIFCWLYSKSFVWLVKILCQEWWVDKKDFLMLIQPGGYIRVARLNKHSNIFLAYQSHKRLWIDSMFIQPFSYENGCTRHVNSHLDELIIDPPKFLRLNFSLFLPNTWISIELTNDHFIRFLLSNEVKKLTARFQISNWICKIHGHLFLQYQKKWRTSIYIYFQPNIIFLILPITKT